MFKPVIKVIIRDLRGHLLHTVTFLFFFFLFFFLQSTLFSRTSLGVHKNYKLKEFIKCTFYIFTLKETVLHIFFIYHYKLFILHGPPMLVDKTNFGLVLYNHTNFYQLEEISNHWSVKRISVFLCLSLVNQRHNNGITVYNRTVTKIENTVRAAHSCNSW